MHWNVEEAWETTENGENVPMEYSSKKKPEISDKDLPLAFSEERHIEKILGIDWKTQTWRMKERVM